MAGRPARDTSGRALLVAMVVLLVCDVVGGAIGIATGAETWRGAWGFDTRSTVPLPVGAVQFALAWVAARDTRPRAGRVAALVLGAICLVSVLAGLFDGDLIGSVREDGPAAPGVLWAVVLLVVTAVVGVRAAARARHLRGGGG